MFPAAANTDRWIEFVGGPFDGYRQSYRSTIRQLASDVFWLVTDDTFRQLNHPRRANSLPIGGLTSVAIYELDIACELPNYRYVGSMGSSTFRDVIRNLN